MVLQITILRGSVIRFRYAVNYVFEPDFSYAIDPDTTSGYSVLELVEKDTEYVLRPPGLISWWIKKPLRYQISDLGG